jgi:hypothetical protein
MSLINVGYDASGNGNNWTANNIDYDTTSTGTDVMVDVPTQWGDDTGVGGEVRGNYATFITTASNMSAGSITNGGLNVSTYGGDRQKRASFGVTSGKWYWETTITGGANANAGVIGIAESSAKVDADVFGSSGFILYYGGGDKYVNGTSSAYGASYTTNDVIGIALDLDSGTKTITFYKNNSSQGSITISGITTAVPLLANGSGSNDTAYSINFGQRPFAYTAPSGFACLCTTNLPEPTIADGGDYFNAVLYTGTGSTQSITGVGFQPDLFWNKCRSDAFSHNLTDSVRGGLAGLSSNSTGAEYTLTNGITFDSDGVTIAQTNNQFNASGLTYVAWNWKANGAGVSNTDGTITSTVSANTDSGFSIVTYTGTGSAATVGHGLGVSPAMVIVKIRSGADKWGVYHSSVITAGATNKSQLVLNSTDAIDTNASATTFTSISSTTFGVGTDANLNGSGSTYVAYCFAPIAGYSAFGLYTGNGSGTDGPFVFLNFRPRYLLIKRTDTASDWVVLDALRPPYNAVDDVLIPNKSDAEASNLGAGYEIDFVSNGFKVRSTWSAENASGGTYIYAAFCENPFKYALAR